MTLLTAFSRLFKLAVRHTPLRVKGVLRSFVTPRLEHLPDSPELFRWYHVLAKSPEVKRQPGGWVYKGKFYPDYLMMGGAGHAIFPLALRFCRGSGVDIGAGFWPLPGAVAVDTQRGPGKGKTIADFEDQSLDYIFSSHCLEHIEQWKTALGEWIQKLKPGGIIFLYLPHPDCEIWHPGSPFVGDGHKWIPTPDILKQTLQKLGCVIEAFDDGPDAMQSFHVCGRKKT